MKINDDLLEALGNVYRWTCGQNTVIISNGRIVTFEKFVMEYFELRGTR